MPPQNEDDVLEVCSRLRDALQSVGETWGAFELAPPPTSDVDAVAQNARGDHLRVQVTRVERDALRELGQRGCARYERTTEQRADMIHLAVEGKTRSLAVAQRAKLLLALDAIQAPGFAQRAVVEAFRRRHGEHVARLGYKAIWLVGPTEALTYRLDA